jgi:hypothetical protein
MQRINSIYDIPDLELSVMGKVGDLHKNNLSAGTPSFGRGGALPI